MSYMSIYGQRKGSSFIHHTDSTGQDGALANMPYMGGMREGVSKAMPFMATSQNTMYGYTWTEKKSNNSVPNGWGKMRCSSKYTIHG